MKLIRVHVHVRRFVRTAEADEIGDDTAVPRRRQNRDHLPVQERPRRFTVQKQYRVAVARSLVEVVHAVAVDFLVMRFKVEIGQILEPFVRRPKNARSNFIGSCQSGGED